VAYTDFEEQRLRIWLAEARESSLTKLTNEPAGAITGYTKQGIHVACGEGELLISQLQWPGGKAVAGAQLKNLQQKLPIGSVLGAAK
jgi:methionyl-tRNA formyltransferase